MGAQRSAVQAQFSSVQFDSYMNFIAYNTFMITEQLKLNRAAQFFSLTCVTHLASINETLTTSAK